MRRRKIGKATGAAEIAKWSRKSAAATRIEQTARRGRKTTPRPADDTPRTTAGGFLGIAAAVTPDDERGRQ
ncbi:hypothetical protein ACQP2K_30635 [Microbispora siamensis]